MMRQRVLESLMKRWLVPFLGIKKRRCNMKIKWFLVGVMLLLVSSLAVGCGIPQDDYDAVVTERDAASTQAETLLSELGQVKSQVGDLENELTTAQGELETMKTSLTAAEKRISSLQSESGKKSSDLAVTGTQIAELKAELEALPKLYYKDDFSDPSSGWLRKSDEGSEWDYENGEYHVLFHRERYTSWWWNRSAGDFTDFALEIDTKVLNESQGTEYGIIFRLQDADNYYYFEVSPSGYYSVGKRFNGHWTPIKHEIGSPFIKEGNSTNRLKVVCKGSQMVFYVNGYHLLTITDETFTGGHIGVKIVANQRNAGAAFDNIVVTGID
ncbi:family 16 glycoside hydrolase [Chloroflexota bacterium]